MVVTVDAWAIWKAVARRKKTPAREAKDFIKKRFKDTFVSIRREGADTKQNPFLRRGKFARWGDKQNPLLAKGVLPLSREFLCGTSYATKN
jgi:hypothetical protein